VGVAVQSPPVPELVSPVKSVSGRAWAFHVKTGLSEYPASQRVDVLPLQVEGDDVLVNIE